jgi:thiol-disulfide isomerase/thioredoxin
MKMIRKKYTNKSCRLLLALMGLGSVSASAQQQDLNLKIHLSGVYKTKISLLTLNNLAAKPVIEKADVKNGETVTLKISRELLPAEFVLRFDYQEKEGSNPYPGEKQIILNKQDVELWAKPKALNHPDSTYFQKEETENRLFVSFTEQQAKQKVQLGLLQNFLMNYDQPQSAFFIQGAKEYENRRQVYNQWILDQVRQHKNTFVSSTFIFQYASPVEWKGTEKDRLNSVIAHYFDDMDFKDATMIRTAGMKDWMNNYVNMYGTMATTIPLRDSLFTLAGRRAIEKAKKGDPLVYGWMVDYFYAGYESFNMTSGIKMLEPYLNDPACLTKKRRAIEQRLKGIESLVAGSIAPDFNWKLASGKSIRFHEFKTEAKYKLVLFWSAECQHCKELMEKLYPWYLQASRSEMMEVFAISLDETETEIPAWEQEKLKLPAFKHKRAEQGIRSPEAAAYFVLSTPTMVLVDSKSNKIVSLPESVEQLQAGMK